MQGGKDTQVVSSKSFQMKATFLGHSGRILLNGSLIKQQWRMVLHPMKWDITKAFRTYGFDLFKWVLQLWQCSTHTPDYITLFHHISRSSNILMVWYAVTQISRCATPLPRKHDPVCYWKPLFFVGGLCSFPSSLLWLVWNVDGPRPPRHWHLVVPRKTRED